MSDPYASITAFEIDLDNGSPDVGCDHKDDSKLSKSERIQRCIDEYDVPGLRKLGKLRLIASNSRVFTYDELTWKLKFVT